MLTFYTEKTKDKVHRSNQINDTNNRNYIDNEDHDCEDGDDMEDDISTTSADADEDGHVHHHKCTADRLSAKSRHTLIFEDAEGDICDDIAIVCSLSYLLQVDLLLILLLISQSQ